MRAQIGPVMAELTGQPADFQLLRGAARVGRLILPIRGCGRLVVLGVWPLGSRFKPSRTTPAMSPCGEGLRVNTAFGQHGEGGSLGSSTPIPAGSHSPGWRLFRLDPLAALAVTENHEWDGVSSTAIGKTNPDFPPRLWKGGALQAAEKPCGTWR